MNIEIYNRVFKGLKKYVTAVNSDVSVYKKPNNDHFPQIVIQEITNKDLVEVGFSESYSILHFEIDVFAKKGYAEGELVDSMEIARSLASVADGYMKNICGMKRTFGNPTPNLDETVYRYTLRYSSTLNVYREMFI